MNEIYKIAEYEIPEDTYFYDSNTEGENIVRFKKIAGKYYLCDANGNVTDEIEQDVSSLTLLEYTSSTAGNISVGSAGYANNSFHLGQASGEMKKVLVGDLQTSGNISSIIPYYSSLTIDNLIVADVSSYFHYRATGHGNVGGSVTYIPRITSYDPNTGNYTATNIGTQVLSREYIEGGIGWDTHIYATVSAKLYVIK